MEAVTSYLPLDKKILGKTKNFTQCYPLPRGLGLERVKKEIRVHLAKPSRIGNHTRLSVPNLLN